MESIRPYRRGFTLIELLVVLAIIAIITAVVLTSQSAFNKTLVLANTAYDVALTLRYAETYGIGSRSFGTTPNTGYGLHFMSGTSGSFTLFADTYPSVGLGSFCHPAPSYDPTGPSAVPGDCVYESGSGGDGTVQVYTLGNGITIANFCAELGTTWTCSSPNSVCASGTTGGLNSLDVVFSRPNPTPFMSENGLYPNPNISSEVTAACIALTSPQGGCKYISVGAAGQISANAASCP